MSFILESIKQAERERKLGQVPSISVEYVTPQDGIVIQRDWIKWATISVVLIGAIMVIWAGFRMTFMSDPNMSVTHVQEMRNDKAPINTEDEILVNMDTSSSLLELESNDAVSDVLPNELQFSSTQSLRNSELKSIHIINDIEEPRPQIVDKRTKVKQEERPQPIQNDETDTVIVNHPTDITTEKNVASKSYQPIHDNEIQRERLFSVYSDLSTSEEQEKRLLPDSSHEIQFIDEGDLHNEISGSTVAIVEPEKFQVVQSSKQAVNTGVTEFGELPYDLQEDIPNLNISVHLFNEESSNRRIRINGRMYTEGANVLPDLALVEITPYGAIFDYQGHLFRLNVR